MRAGEHKRVDLLAEQAYGLYDPSATMTVERRKVPDMNHPLAGKNLVFDVKVLKVEKRERTPATGKKP